MVVASSTAIIIGLTWGGVQFAWTSSNVLVPLIVGFVGMVGFFIYEATLAKEPLVSNALSSYESTLIHRCKIPFVLVSNRTSLSG